MQRDDLAYLLDMLIAAKDGVRFASEVTEQQFKQSQLYQNANIKALEIVGEAANSLSESTRDAHPEISWTAMIGMRNRLVHAYFATSLETVWDVAQNALPELIEQLTPLLQLDEDE